MATTEAAALSDGVLEDWVQPSGPGAAVAIVRDGDVSVACYGLADLEHGVPITAASRFGAASISKQFTCMCVVILAERGELGLDASVRTYLPELGAFADPITLAQLMSHTSGLRELWELMTLAGWHWADRSTHRDALRIITRQHDGNFAPGSDWSYCNSSYVLLTEVVQRTTGMSLRALADELIFEPLEMRSTCFQDDPSELMPGRTRAYEQRAGAYVHSEPNTEIVGNTGLFTTVEDLSRWDANFEHARVGGHAVIDRLLTPAPLSDGRQTTYGLGVHVRTLDGRPVIEHSGGHAGYRAHYLRLPQERVSVIVLANTTIPAPAIAVAIARRALGQTEARARRPRTGSLAVTDAIYRRRDSGFALRLQSCADGPVLGFWPDARIDDQPEVLVMVPHVLSPGQDGLRAVIDHDDRQELVISDSGDVLTMMTANSVFPWIFERVEPELDPAPVDSRLGRLRSDELDAELEAWIEDGRLQLQAPRIGRLSLEWIGWGAFASGGLTVELRPDALIATTGASRNIVLRRER